MMRRRLWIATMGLTLTLGCGTKQPARPTDDGPDPVKPASSPSAAQEREKIQGVWFVAALEEDGREVGEARGRQMIFEGERFTIKDAAGSTIASGVCKLDPSKLDLVYERGPHAGKTSLSLYEFDNDRLRLRLAPPGAERPTRFAEEGKPEQARLVLTRKKTEAARTDPLHLEAGKLRDTTWIVVGVEEQGRRVTNGVGRQLIFLGDHFNLKDAGGKLTAHGVWRLGAFGRTTTLDLMHHDEKHKGKTSAAIVVYEADGLRIAIAPPGSDRPLDMVTKAGAAVSVLTLWTEKAVKDAAEMEKFVGNWEVQSAEEKGKPADGERGREFIFQGSLFNIRDGKGATLSFGVCEPLRQGEPRKMDLHYKGGPHTGKTAAAVYHLDGDQLKIHLAPPGAPPPADLTTKPDGEGTLYVLMRKK